jgi:hypothetical protein
VIDPLFDRLAGKTTRRPDELSEEDLEAIKNLVFGRRKIEAIRRYRELTGMDLKHAKDVIDELDEHLRQDFPDRFTPAPQGSGRGIWLIVGLVVVGMAIWWIVELIGTRQAREGEPQRPQRAAENKT